MACEYCDGDKPIVANNAMGVRATINDYHEEIYINFYTDQGWVCVSTPIDFCPMCGEKLGGDAS